MSHVGRPPDSVDALIVGGGLYGSKLAAFLAQRFSSVALVERAETILTRASYANQARIHGGYHYPRSILTSSRSRHNYSRFISDYAPAVVNGFTKIYAIARHQSKTSASQFEQFCRRIAAPIARAPKAITSRFDSTLVDGVFVVEECAFDARKLAECMRTELTRASVSTTTGVTATAIRLGQSRRLRVEWGSGHAPAYTEADWVVLATYSALNQLLEKSELPPIPLVHELAEIVIVNVPSALREIGITVMDGPFWSAMPFPALNAHSLTHVRYTPHARWHSSLLRGQPGFNEAILQAPRDSHAEPMRRDAARYFPELQSARPMTSLWEIKTVLPRSEVDDSRPILVRPFAEAPGLIAVLGAKIDSVYDVENVITRHLTEGGA